MKKNNLIYEDENVVYKSKIHRAILIPSLSLIIGGFALQIFNFPWELTWTLVALGGFTFFKRLFFMTSTQYTLTTKRVVLNHELAEKHHSMLMLNRCDSVTVNQDPFGSMFGYGTVVVHSGINSLHFSYVKDPMKFHDEINRQIEVAQRVAYND